jgi:hypothetical protein
MESQGGSVDMEAIAAKPPGDNDEGISFADGFENNHCDFEHDSLMPDLETHDALDPSYIDKTKGGSTLSSPLAYAGQFELGAVNVLFNQPSPVSSPAGRCIFTFVLLACIQRQDLQAGAVGNARSSLERTPSSAESPSSLGYLHSQTAGMAAKSHGSISANQWQWHPHTVKVLSLLRQQFHGGTCGDDAGSVSTGTTSYNYITGASGGKKVGRRTAAGVFFEMLQLKTWDYVDVAQANPYGDIAISRASRFDEEVEGVKSDQ